MSTSRIDLLRNVSLFEGLPDQSMQKLENSCNWHHKKPGEHILTRDSVTQDVFFVLNGSVRIVNFSSSGREVSYATIRAGDYFGELPAIDGESRSASVVAQEECLLASVPPKAYQELLEDNVVVALRSLKKLALIIRRCNDRILNLTTLGAHQRVYVELVRLAEPDKATPSVTVIWPLPTQSQIAARASTTRETVARVLSKLAKEEIVRRKGKSLYILNMTELENLAEGVNSML